MSQLISKGNELLNKLTENRYWKGLAVLGALAVSKYVYKALSIGVDFLIHLLPLEKNHLQRYGEGSWAVVTGASDGIGKSFCYQLAKRGFNIVLIARNEDKLKSVAFDITAKYPKVQTQIIVADFSKAASVEFFNDIIIQLGDLDVSVLVNNVGTVARGMFHTYKRPDMINLLVINCLPVLILSHHFIQRFSKRQHKSAIINLSSCTGLIPASSAPLYSPSKAYIYHLTQALAAKYGQQIDFLCLMPSIVTTGMTGNLVNFMSVTPDQCTEGALNHLRRRTWTFATWRHYIICSIYGSADYFTRLYYKLAYGNKVNLKVDRNSFTPDLKL